VTLDLSGDLVAAAVSKLTDALSAKGYLGNLVGRDASGGAFSTGWVFAGFDDDGRPFRDVEGTGKAAIVMHDRNEWAVNPHNTARFPVLMVVVYADSSRNPDGTMQYRDGMIRARMVNNVVNRTFHDAANVDHEWPLGVTVVSCVKADGTSFTDVPTAEGVVRALTRFEVCMAE
jgi:hypothetical protein